MKIGLFYGSTTCYTEMAAEKISHCINDKTDEQTINSFDIKDTPLATIEDYDILIFGISTWDFGELQEDWEGQWDDLDEIDLDGKIIALFGLGDQVGYTEWFQDALGLLHDKVVLQGAVVIGYWPNQGYEFEKSLALTEDKSEFLGLALDDESQYELSEERIKTWCAQLLDELAA
jgi:flavodoxin II